MAENIGPQGISWEHTTFNPKASLAKKLLKYISLGYFQYKDPSPILDDVKGDIYLGDLLALMGPSGAGKSSLMKCLTDGLCYSGFTGKIMTFGVKEKIRASIIHQDEKEHLILNLTVKETLMYASQLKNRYWCAPSNFHEENVQELMVHLGLENKANTLVDKCSGGEKKRVAIGVELSEKLKPHILFLDEPTTGLDSSVAFTVIKSLDELAKTNHMAVVATIHQPSEEILNVFDKAIILSGKGDVVFHDDPSVASLQRFLSKTLLHQIDGNALNCFRNPADIMIGLASSLKRDKEENSSKVQRKSCYTKLKNILLLSCDSTDFENCVSVPFLFSGGAVTQNHGNSSFQRTFEGMQAQNVCKNMIDVTKRGYKIPEGDQWQDYSYSGLLCRTNSSILSFFSLYGFWTLLKRTWKLRINLGKNGIILRFLIYLLVVIVTTQFYERDIGKDGGCVILEGGATEDPRNCTCLESIQEIQGETAVSSNIKLIFFFLLFLSLESLLNVALTFPREFKLFLHEFRNGWYSVPSYFFAKVLVEIPAQLIIPTAYSIYFYVYTQQEDFGIVWNSGDTQTGERFKIYLRATYFSGFIAQGLGFLIGILCVKSVSKAILMSSGTILGLSFFCGFFKKRVGMTDGEELLTKFSFLRYGLETMLLSIYGRGRCRPPTESYAMVSFGIRDDELHDNWIGFFRLMGITWGITFIMLEFKASKWYLLKVIKHLFVVLLGHLENCCKELDRVCQISKFFDKITKCFEGPFLKLWTIVRCIGVIFVWYFVILGIFPLALYICIADFYGAWS